MFKPPTANADGDPFTDWEEYVADTHPDNPSWYPEIQGAYFNPLAGPAIRYDSSIDRLYTLFRSSNLVSGSWSAVPGQGPRLGYGAFDFFFDTNAPPDGAGRFYRIEAQLPSNM